MTGYTKLFGSIITSTIWREDKETKILWITMLALKNKVGIVEGSIPGLADMARLSLNETVKALKVLSDPDEFSRTKEFEGRRIQSVDGGWLILNHEKWRNKMNADERREYLRIKQQEHRARQQPVNKRKQKSTLSTHTDKDTDKETRVPASNWLTSDDLWIDLQRILPEQEVKDHIGLWIARIKENPRALYESVCDFKHKRNQRKIRNVGAWLTQRYQHFKNNGKIVREDSAKLRDELKK